jgi:thioredoxin reductase (NADPH)
MFFSLHARSVTMIVRGDSLAKGMSQYLVDQIQKTENISVRLCTSVVEVKGDESLEFVTLLDAKTGKTETVPAMALFIFIGAMPRTDWTANLLVRDEQGFLLSGPDLMLNGQRPKGWLLERDPFLLETNVPGIFVAGDVRHGSIKRVASGVGEGSIAIQFVHRYLSEVV